MTTSTGALAAALAHLRAIAGSSTATVSDRRRARKALAAAGVATAELEQLERRAEGKASCSSEGTNLVCHNPRPLTTDAIAADFKRKYGYGR